MCTSKGINPTTNSTQNMILPTIHSNGTSAKCLTEGYTEARHAVEAAISQLSKVEFNSRDYYVQNNNAWTSAVAERMSLFEKLRAVASELAKIEEHCADFIK